MTNKKIKEVKQKKSNRVIGKNVFNPDKNQTVEKIKNDEITKLVEIILIVLVVFVGFYIITSFITKNSNNNTEKITEDDKIIQYDQILIGNIFNQTNSEYYVLITNKYSDYKDSLDYYLQNYKQKEGAIKFYTADTNEILNKTYVSEKSNLNVDDIKEFKVCTTTLVLIKDKKIQKSVEGDIEVIKELIQISK